MGNQLKLFLKDGCGCMSRVVIFLQKYTHIKCSWSTPHPTYVCMHSFCNTSFVMCLLVQYISANGVCLHLLVPPYTLLLHQHLLHNCMYSDINRWAYFQEKNWGAANMQGLFPELSVALQSGIIGIIGKQTIDTIFQTRVWNIVCMGKC